MARGNHPVHQASTALRKMLRVKFPGQDIGVSTNGCSRWNGFAAPSIWVGWRGGPPLSEVSAAVSDCSDVSGYSVKVEHLFDCPHCGREHPGGEDDMPVRCPRLASEPAAAFEASLT
jgi:hypothetical protein